MKSKTGMTYKPHQVEGAAFLRERKVALLADEMGVGKTPTSILASKHMKKILVVCPATAKLNWQREFLKFEGRPSFVTGQKKQPTSDIVITNYTQVVNKLSRYKSVDWDVVIFDESHNVKEPGTQRTIALFGSKGLIHSCKQIWCLTGTPAPNHIGEVWVLLFTFGFTELSYEGFVNRYCTTMHVRNVYAALRVTGTNTTFAHEVKEVLKKFSLRRKLLDVVKDMPKATLNTVVVESDYDPLKDFPEMAEKLKEEWALLKQKVDWEGEDISDGKLLDIMTLMAPSISSLRRFHGLKKLPVCIDIIKQELEDDAYKKIVLFAIHKDIVDMIVKGLKEFNPVKVNGTVSIKNRDAAVERFQNDDTCRVFVGNIAAAGTALTLTAANQVALIEPDWVPGNNAQAISRVARIGQKLPVFARIFSLPGFDDRLLSALARKTKEISTFID